MWIPKAIEESTGPDDTHAVNAIHLPLLISVWVYESL